MTHPFVDESLYSTQLGQLLFWQLLLLLRSSEDSEVTSITAMEVT